MSSPKIDRLTYAWAAQVWPVVTVSSWWMRQGEGVMDYWLFQRFGMHFKHRTNPPWIQGQDVQSAVQCHHKHDKFLGTYRDRKAVSHWGGNGLFNCLPASCEDISWLQEYCHTSLSQPAVSQYTGSLILHKAVWLHPDWMSLSSPHFKNKLPPPSASSVIIHQSRWEEIGSEVPLLV